MAWACLARFMINNNNGSIWFTLSRPFLFCASAVFIGFCFIVQASAQDDSDNTAPDTGGLPQNKVIRKINLGGNPFAIAVSRNSKLVYVTDPLNEMVYKISAKKNRIIKKFPVTNPYGVAVTPDGKTLYVTNYLDSGVYAINANTGEIVATLSLSSAAHPRCPVVTPDGTAVWVGGGNAVCVYVIDTDSNSLGSFTGKDLAVPTSIAFSPEGDLAYVTDLQNQSIVEFDLGGVEQGVVNLSYGPTWCRVNAETGALYADRPYQIDSDIPEIFQFTVLSSGVDTVTTSEIPSYFSVTKNGKYLYVPFAHASATETGNTVVMYNATTLEPVGNPIKVGNEPEFATVAPNGKRAYVSNFADGTVSVINTVAR
jgi:YVTN family beta-propeller protein